MSARVVNAALGLWLFSSAFFLPETASQRMNAWLVGIAAVTLALADLYGRSWARYLNAALGGWLILSTIFMPGTAMATFWNNVAVGFGLVLFSFLSGEPRVREPRWV